MSSTEVPLESRFSGCILGLAAGDALGTTLEFQEPGTFEPIEDMEGGGPWGLNPGEWTDDTSMALCLAESLLHQKGFDPHDQLDRYVRWWQEGYRSSTGECFDIGNTTREALIRYEETGDPYPGPTRESTAGNGSLMRLAPVPLYYYGSPKQAIQKAGRSSRTTHGTLAAVDACKYFGGLIYGALDDSSKQELLRSGFHPMKDRWPKGQLVEEIETVAEGSFQRRDPPEIQGQGYVVRSLEAALWAFDRTDSLKEGLLQVVNLGRDADTTGAIYGQLAGAFYGAEAIPKEWRERLIKRSLLKKTARQLLKANRTRRNEERPKNDRGRKTSS